MHAFVQMIVAAMAMECPMSESSAESAPKAADLRAMAAAAGVDLSDERAEALVPQAAPHFAMLRALDDVADPATEPAAEFRLDAWRRGGDD